MNSKYNVSDMAQAVIGRVKSSIHMIQSDLQSREEGQQRVHPGASGKQRFVDVDIEQQWRLANVLHYGCIVLNGPYKVEGLRIRTIDWCLVIYINRPT